MTTISRCRAKTPSECPHHGAGKTLTELQDMASAAAEAKDFKSYALARNAMDELFKDSAAVSGNSSIAEVNAAARKLINEADRQYADFDAETEKELKAKMAVPAGGAFKFYDLKGPVMSSPESYEFIRTSVNQLQAGDVLRDGIVRSVYSDSKTPSGKQTVIYMRHDGTFVKSHWHRGTEMSVSRQKNEGTEPFV